MNWLRLLISRKARLEADIDACLAKRKADRLSGYIPVNASKRRAG